MAARARRVRQPREAGWPRRLAWWCWSGAAALARPAVFAGLIALSGYLAFDGMRHLDARVAVPTGANPVTAALAGVAPDAASATSLWGQEVEAAMRPRAAAPPDSILAGSLIAAFEDIAGRERFSSMVWADMRGLPLGEAEAALRALPVWVRHRELEYAWSSRLSSASTSAAGGGAAGLVPATARSRLERASRLYDAADLTQAAFFSGHEDGALNLSVLPGLVSGDRRDIWLADDRAALDAFCTAPGALECRLAQMGGEAGAGQGARLLRAALATGHASHGFRQALEASDRDTLRTVASELATVAHHTSNIEAIRLTALLETPEDAARLRRLSVHAGPRTLAMAHFLGREALALDNGEASSGTVTPEARQRFVSAAIAASLAFGLVLAALSSALSVRLTGRAGLGQRMDLRMRELLLGRKV